MNCLYFRNEPQTTAIYAYVGMARSRLRQAVRKERISAAPSVEPKSTEVALSGWGIMPTTFPPSLHMPAMSLTEPLGLSV